MTNKQKILRMVEKWPEDIPFEKAVYHMSVLQAIAQAIEEADQDEGMEHEAFFKQLLSDEEEDHPSGGSGEHKESSEPSKRTSPRTRQERQLITFGV